MIRRLAHEPLGWRPTVLEVVVRRYRCADCGHVWRQDTSAAAEPRAKLSRTGLRWALEGIVVAHLTVARVAEGLGLAWDTANNAVLAEGKRLLLLSALGGFVLFPIIFTFGMSRTSGVHGAMMYYFQTSWLRLLPGYIGYPLLVLSLFGWISWRHWRGVLVSLCLIGYGLIFAIIGRSDTFYWGFLMGPLLGMGMVFLRISLPNLVGAA